MPSHFHLEYLFLTLPALFIWCGFVYRYRLGVASFLRGQLVFLRAAIRFPAAVWLMAIPIVWLGATLHFEFDEARTFLSFTVWSIHRPIMYYPSPNNHVLHSILTQITWRVLGWTGSELSVRLPAILFSLMTAALASRVFLKGNRLLTILLTTALLLCEGFLTYSFQARSYSMQCFFAVAGLTAILGMDTYPPDRRFAAFVLTCILGCYSSPAYLYTVFPLACMFLARERGWIMEAPRRFAIIALTGAATIILLYSPIMLVEGLKAITSNRYVVSHPDLAFWDPFRHYYNILPYVVLPGLAGVSALVLTQAFALTRGRISWTLLILCPIFMMVVMRQTPPPRTFLPIGTLILVLAFHSMAEWMGTRPVKPWMTGLAFSVMAVTAAYRVVTIDSINVLAANRTYRRIEALLPRDTESYHKGLQWFYYDPVIAYAKLKGRRLVQIPDTTTLLPGRGRLVTSERMTGLRCVDSAGEVSEKVGRAYVYALDGQP